MIYTYAELKGRIKVGDKVKRVEGTQNYCYHLNDNKIGTITEVGNNTFCINGCVHDYSENGYLDLLNEEITWDTLKAGDVVINNISDDEHRIIDRLPNSVVLSYASDRTINNVVSIEDLKVYFTIKQPPKPTTVKVRLKNGEVVEGEIIKE